MSCSKKRKGRPSAIDHPDFLPRLWYWCAQKSACPNTLRYSYQVVADDVNRHHGTQFSRDVIYRKMQRLNADGPWRRRKRKQK
jgi:hypothetical protein